jgi:hypothetical protein
MNSHHNKCDSIVRMEYIVDWAVDAEVCRQIGRINALNGGVVVSMPSLDCCSRLNSLQMTTQGKRKWMEVPIELLGQEVPTTTKFVVLVTCIIYEKHKRRQTEFLFPPVLCEQLYNQN